MKLSSNLPVGKQINFQPYYLVNPRYHTSLCSVSYRFQSIFMAKSFKQENIRLATWFLTLQGRAFHQVKKITWNCWLWKLSQFLPSQPNVHTVQKIKHSLQSIYIVHFPMDYQSLWRTRFISISKFSVNLFSTRRFSKKVFGDKNW